MHEITERVCVAEEPGPLWHEIGRFGAVGAWHPMLRKVESDGDHEGCQRIAETRPALIIIRLQSDIDV